MSIRPNRSLALLLILLPGAARAEPKDLELALESRDPKTNHIESRTEKVASNKVGVVIVDPWNYHWCMTACERVSAMAPRWNRCLQCARKLGMTVIWAPSDVAGSYAGCPQRERALGTPLVPVPIVREMPPASFTAPKGPCMCGPGISCLPNYGFDAINPQLKLADSDYIASSTGEVYSLLHKHGATHVIYMGLHTNMCLFDKPGALKYMVQAGLACMVARDVNDAFSSYDPKTGYTPDRGTQQTDEDLERAGVPTINMRNVCRRAGVWDDQWIVETVRITPWGKPDRPYFFETSETVTLTAPWLENAEIRYTLDGSPAGPDSPLCRGPIVLTATATLRAAAFRQGKLISVPTDARFVRLPPMPPKPDVYLDDLQYVIDPYGQIAPVYAACLWIPKVGTSYEGKPLRIRNTNYAKGLGFRAPAAVRYPLKPEYERFVARTGIADNMLDHELGRNLARYPSIVFRVFVDAEMLAESPTMRISQEPWRFDVKLPRRGRYINLVCMDSGSHNPLNLGNWVDAGFVARKR
jgi:hypothetical protein